MIGFPTGHSGRSKLSRRDIMLALPVDRQSISCRATDESPGKISLSTKQPAQSSILICERRAVGKNFANFCRSVDSNRCQHLQYLPKAVIKGRPQGLLVALCPCRPSSTCSPSVLPKLKQIPTGLSECALLVPPRLGEHRAVVLTFPACSLRALE